MEYIVFGLGNPGDEYKNSRHSVGRVIVNALAEENDFSPWSSDKKKKTEIAKGMLKENSFTFVKSLTYMNDSGLAAKHFIKIPKDRMRFIVVHDDLDLPFGDMRLVFARGSAGHKGVLSVSKHIKSEEYFRIRVGISVARAKGGVKKPDNKKGVSEYVLKDFSKKEREEIKTLIPALKEALIAVASGVYGKKPSRFSTHIYK